MCIMRRGRGQKFTSPLVSHVPPKWIDRSSTHPTCRSQAYLSEKHCEAILVALLGDHTWQDRASSFSRLTASTPGCGQVAVARVVAVEGSGIVQKSLQDWEPSAGTASLREVPARLGTFSHCLCFLPELRAEPLELHLFGQLPHVRHQAQVRHEASSLQKPKDGTPAPTILGPESNLRCPLPDAFGFANHDDLQHLPTLRP